jgi:hypothetical protein
MRALIVALGEAGSARLATRHASPVDGAMVVEVAS